MPTRLQRLISYIEPIPDRIQQMGDEVAESFRVESSAIEDGVEFPRCFARFYHELDRKVLGIRGREFDLKWTCERCVELLRQQYGQNPRHAVFDVVRTGAQGGLRRVLNDLAAAYCHDYALNLIRMTVQAYWDQREPSQLVADIREYISEWRHIIPSEIAEASAGRILGHFQEVLVYHPFVVRHLRNSTGRPAR